MEIVGRYTIIGRLGRGGMSTVYKARAPVTGRIVALKILRPRDEILVDLAGKERLRRMFVEEARIMGTIDHEHVASILDCDEHDGSPFIVLEYFSHSLGDIIGEAYRVEARSRQLSVERSCSYALQTLRGLERLHFAGIFHRDIKPYNLMLTNTDQVKIIDFGLSRVRGEEPLTIPGMQVGSPYYAAPEQARGPEQVDGRADLYSVGVMLYRMLTGCLRQPGELVRLPVDPFNGGLAGGWHDFLARALAEQPRERFADATVMRRELERLARHWQLAGQRRDPVEEAREVVADDDGKSPVRSQAVRIMYKDVRGELGLDELFRPTGYHHHRLEARSELLLYDPLTDLVWQRGGSGFPLNWHQAHDYVGHLNDCRFGGRTGWRLPTTAELVTVLRSASAGRSRLSERHAVPSLRWLWSADHCTRKAAWMVDFVENYIGRLDKDGAAWVMAVSDGRSGAGTPPPPVRYPRD
ncbi:MAG: protein kinase domain-containing protein [Desulfopila sp.]